MSWFDTAGFASLAKSALNTAQKTIDRALDIQDADSNTGKPITRPKTEPAQDESFFSAYGVSSQKPSTSSISTEQPTKNTVLNTDSPSKIPKSNHSPSKLGLGTSGLWGDWGSFYVPKSQSSQSTIQVSEPKSPKKLLPSPEKNEDETVNIVDHISDVQTVLSQPQAEKLFPIGKDKKGAPLKLSLKSEDSSSAKATDLETNKESLVQTDQPLTVSVLLSEMTPKIASASSDVLLGPRKSVVEIVTKPPVPFLRTQEEGGLIELVLSDDEEDDETEEELTIMEKNPSKTSEKNLELPLVPCFTNIAKGSPSSEYCFIEDDGLTLIETPEVPSKDNIFSSASMEFIIPEEQNFGSQNESEMVEDIKKSQSTAPFESFSSPESVVPILEEPLSNLSSPRFPEFHIQVTRPENRHILPAEMCDSDVTLISPSAEEEESSDSEKENLQLKPPLSEDCLTLEEPLSESRDLRECETSSSASKSSSSGSFVNCSLEDGDPGYTARDSGGSTVASERSDQIRTEAETSGHTSGDDIETTTSSDIEIISPSNGESCGGSSLSPLKHMWKTRPPKSKRSESPASDSSKESMMPVVPESEELKSVF